MVSADAGAHSTGVTALFRSKKMSPLRSLVSMSLGMTPSWSGFTWYNVRFCAYVGSMPRAEAPASSSAAVARNIAL